MITRSKVGTFKPRIYNTTVLENQESTSYTEALAYKEQRATIEEEYKAFIKNKTWTLISLLPGRKLIGCKLVYKLKRHADGSIARYKARLFAKGMIRHQAWIFLKHLALLSSLPSLGISYLWKLQTAGK